MGWGGVITSCGVRWIESCGNLEDVASLKMLLRCRRRMVLSLQATASESLCGREDEKGVKCDVHFVHGSPVNYDIF